MKQSIVIIVMVSIVACCGLLLWLYHKQNRSIHFVIVTPSYNNERYCLKNVQTVVDQTYTKWRMIIINDCSSDKTSALLHEYVNKNNLAHKIKIIDNATRQGALKNIYDIIHQECNENDVVITLDGDDWLSNEHVLARIARTYANGKTWLTYGQYKEYPAGRLGICRRFPDAVIKRQLFRSHEWFSSHLRTFYAWLFKKIAKDDLLYNGEFFPVTWDLAIMFPMLEMAADDHITFIPDIIYIYNCDNPLNDYKCHLELQQKLVRTIRSKSKYSPL